MKNKLLNFLIIIAAVVSVGVIQSYEGLGQIMADIEKRPYVVIDPGHGGIDGGAESSDGTCEKDINLSIAEHLKEQLEKENIKVKMTRTSDRGLYEDKMRGSIRSLKTYDMKKRREIIDDAGADITVSIHLNSFTQDTSVRGAQVFYPEYGKGDSAGESKKAAEMIQKYLNREINSDHPRTELAKSDVILMRDVNSPTVIVECGFLSNKEEAYMLKKRSYQYKIVKVLKKSICSYLGAKSSESK